MMMVLYVAAGGAFGSVCRYLAMSWVGSFAGKEFPYATLFVNIVGSFLLGLTIGMIATFLPRGREIHALIAIGMLGGFTTFSTFSMDLYLLIEKGQYLPAAGYAGGSVIVSVMAFFFGMWLLRQFA